jgi:ABC-type amino acid transport substrate-binding protein
MPVEFLMVTSANRISIIETGKADLECGSTTNNAERRQKVGFTIPHFITGARLLVRANSTVERIEDLNGKNLVSTKGTTPLKAAEQANRERLLGVKIMEAPDHAKAVEMVESSAADAFVMDDVLLFGLASNRPNPAALKVVGKFLTTEPLAIMLPKNDPEFKKVVDTEMRRLIQSGEVVRQAHPPQQPGAEHADQLFAEGFLEVSDGCCAVLDQTAVASNDPMRDRASPMVARATAMSWSVCKPSQNSGLVPRYLARRKAVSTDTARRSRTTS